MVYDYDCENCGEIQIEAKPSEIPIKNCPRCGSKNMERIFKPIGISFKGSGFYINDSKGG